MQLKIDKYISFSWLCIVFSFLLSLTFTVNAEIYYKELNGKQIAHWKPSFEGDVHPYDLIDVDYDKFPDEHLNIAFIKAGETIEISGRVTWMTTHWSSASVSWPWIEEQYKGASGVTVRVRLEYQKSSNTLATAIIDKRIKVDSRGYFSYKLQLPKSRPKFANNPHPYILSHSFYRGERRYYICQKSYHSCPPKTHFFDPVFNSGYAKIYPVDFSIDEFNENMVINGAQIPLVEEYIVNNDFYFKDEVVVYADPNDEITLSGKYFSTRGLLDNVVVEMHLGKHKYNEGIKTKFQAKVNSANEFDLKFTAPTLEGIYQLAILPTTPELNGYPRRLYLMVGDREKMKTSYIFKDLSNNKSQNKYLDRSFSPLGQKVNEAENLALKVERYFDENRHADTLVKEVLKDKDTFNEITRIINLLNDSIGYATIKARSGEIGDNKHEQFSFLGLNPGIYSYLVREERFEHFFAEFLWELMFTLDESRWGDLPKLNVNETFVRDDGSIMTFNDALIHFEDPSFSFNKTKYVKRMREFFAEPSDETGLLPISTNPPTSYEKAKGHARLLYDEFMKFRFFGEVTFTNKQFFRIFKLQIGDSSNGKLLEDAREVTEKLYAISFTYKKMGTDQINIRFYRHKPG